MVAKEDKGGGERMSLQTYIITRFNLPLRFEKNKNGISNVAAGCCTDCDYLEKRMMLFKKFTFPSVKGQINQNFKWLCLFDDRTPEMIKEQIRLLEEDYDNFVPVFLGEEEGTHSALFLKNFLSKQADSNEKIVTVRLDNDDAIGKRYIEEVTNYVEKNDLCDCAINFVYGVNLYLERRVMKTRYAENNHFYAMVASKESTYLHPFEFSHVNLTEKMKVINIGKREYPVWMEVIHDSNYANGTSKNSTAKQILSGYELGLGNEERESIIWV